MLKNQLTHEVNVEKEQQYFDDGTGVKYDTKAEKTFKVSESLI